MPKLSKHYYLQGTTTVRRQAKNYWCGIASIANALEVLGIKRSQREIARLCDVNPEAGCNEIEMKRALLANGIGIDEWQYRSESSSEDWLWDHINNRGPVILCVDDDDHWVAVIGGCNWSWLVFDPSRNQGVEVHDWSSLAQRWRNSEGIYYGLGCSK